MKRRLLALAALCLCALVLAPAAFADMGPKPQVVIRVEDWPAEADGFYLDLLVRDEPRNNLLENDGTYDAAMLGALQQLELDGWHAARAGGTSRPLFGDIRGARQPDGSMEFTFGYLPPDEFRVVAVWPDGTVHVGTELYRRTRFFETLRLDLAAMRLTPYYPLPWPDIARQFCQTFFPTLLIEGLLLAAFGFGRARRNWLTLAWVNLATQAALTAALSYALPRTGTFLALLYLPAAELPILLAEAFLYRRFLTGQSKSRRTAYAVTANLASWACGVLLLWAFPIW